MSPHSACYYELLAASKIAKVPPAILRTFILLSYLFGDCEALASLPKDSLTGLLSSEQISMKSESDDSFYSCEGNQSYI